MSKCVLDVLGRMIAENHGDATDEDATAAVRELKEAHRVSACHVANTQLMVLHRFRWMFGKQSTFLQPHMKCKHL